MMRPLGVNEKLPGGHADLNVVLVLALDVMIRRIVRSVKLPYRSLVCGCVDNQMSCSGSVNCCELDLHCQLMNMLS